MEKIKYRIEIHDPSVRSKVVTLLAGYLSMSHEEADAAVSEGFVEAVPTTIGFQMLVKCLDNLHAGLFDDCLATLPKRQVSRHQRPFT